ncbi:MFS transporter [Paenibacillus sp. J5C_2022]|uniref:MFS transporter n=1 Tax=Paenibacillus sp. J5C2022 TaxID=2977129 RepID=UPI0021CF8F16|nr:MFS transporter [Paenibacillus sp. J5C2022]MCU6707417.1 MFS transporter [Paenibacillus sp. J5C2022]
MTIWADIRTFSAVPGARRLLGALFFYGIGLGILAPMNSIYLSDSIGLGKGEIVSVFSISALLNMAVTMTVGAYSDRMRQKKPIALTAAVICMLGLLVYMRADSYTGALIGMCIAAAPSGLIMGQLFAISRHHFTRLAPTLVEMALIWLRSSLSVGFFSGLLIGANLYVLATFQGVLWGNVGGYAALVILLLLHRELDSTPSKEAGSENASTGERFSLLMLLAILMIACADSIRGLYLPLVVKELFGRAEIASYIWSVQAVFELLLMTVSGYWAARYGTKPVLIIGGVSAIICYAVYIWSPPLILFFLVQPLYSLFVSIKFGVAMGYVQRMFLSRSGFGASLYECIILMATLVGYVLPLFIAGYHPLLFYMPLVIVALALLMIGWTMLSDRRQHDKKGDYRDSAAI